MKMINNHAQLKQLPLGHVVASGWLREQLLRNKDGIGGHLPELEPRMIATLYTTKETEPLVVPICASPISRVRI